MTTNGDHPKRRRRRRVKKDGTLEVRHARQIASIVERAEGKQKADAVEMRLRGKGYHEIAAELDVSVQAVSKWVNGTLREAVDIDRDRLEEQHQLELNRLERLWSVWFPRATRDGVDDEGNPLVPNLAAATLCMKIAKRRAELIGLDREVKVAPSFNINVGSEQLRQLVEASQDPEVARAIEMTAALFAHGEEALEGEWSEDLDAGAGDGDEEADGEGDPEDRPDHHVTE